MNEGDSCCFHLLIFAVVVYKCSELLPVIAHEFPAAMPTERPPPDGAEHEGMDSQRGYSAVADGQYTSRKVHTDREEQKQDKREITAERDTPTFNICGASKGVHSSVLQSNYREALYHHLSRKTNMAFKKYEFRINACLSKGPTTHFDQPSFQRQTK